jgi:hypothetical protein
VQNLFVTVAELRKMGSLANQKLTAQNESRSPGSEGISMEKEDIRDG